MTTVQEIHNEFFSAEERLLNEAIRIIDNPQVTKANNVARYVALGFGSCKPVQDSQDLAKKEVEARDLRKTISHFQQYYPNNKFITEAEVKRISEKYGLLLGDASNYIGDIPDKNLAEIEAFKLHKVDWTEKRSFINIWEVAMVDYFRPRAYWASGPEINIEPKKDKQVETEKAAFKICAPPTDFNTAGYEIREGFKLVYDPIVLQPVKGGFLIVSAWGEEASDELVINQKMN